MYYVYDWDNYNQHLISGKHMFLFDAYGNCILEETTENLLLPCMQHMQLCGVISVLLHNTMQSEYAIYDSNNVKLLQNTIDTVKCKQMLGTYMNNDACIATLVRKLDSNVQQILIVWDETKQRLQEIK